MSELTIEKAEQLAGKRLDRRYKWFLWYGEVCFDGKWTGPCSGCSCDSEYPCSCCNKRGGGCHECGFSGRRVHHFPCPHWTLDIAKEDNAHLKAYSFHDGEPIDGAVLVFAHNFQEAKKIAYRTVNSWTGCDFIDVKGHWIRSDTWLKEHAADKKKLDAGECHVIESPPTCEGCELWHDELDDSGYCETCAEEREEAA